MKYSEFSRGPQGRRITVGTDVWVVDYVFEDGTKPPVRNIPPTRVQFRNSHDYPHFISYKRDGTLKHSGSISTRSANTRHAINVFVTEEEAREFYHEQCEKAKQVVQDALDNMIRSVTERLLDIDSRITTNQQALNNL
jgi:hypothetical protein